MTADIKQLADLARDENPGLPLFAFGHSMGSALTQAHIENHSDLLAGAILRGTLSAVPASTRTTTPASSRNCRHSGRARGAYSTTFRPATQSLIRI
jgi:alpha-beta hydrolase superfamily lysophospholipase